MGSFMKTCIHPCSPGHQTCLVLTAEPDQCLGIRDCHSRGSRVNIYGLRLELPGATSSGALCMEEYQPCLGPPELTVTSFPWWDGPVLGVKKSGALGRGRPGLPGRTAPSASVSSSLHGGGGLGLHFHLGMCLGVPEVHLDGELIPCPGYLTRVFQAGMLLG